LGLAISAKFLDPNLLICEAPRQNQLAEPNGLKPRLTAIVARRSSRNGGADVANEFGKVSGTLQADVSKGYARSYRRR
jgi:hypothetical protein